MMFGNKKKRADKEIDIVVKLNREFESQVLSCEREIQDYLLRLKDIKDNYFELEKRTDKALDDIEMTSINNEKKRLIRNKKKYEAYLKNTEIERDNFSMVTVNLSKLLMYIKVFYRRKEYKYIIKVIPEKKLPKMLNSTEKTREVNDLVNELLSMFRKEANRRKFDFEEAQKEEDKINRENDELDSLIQSSDDEEIEAMRMEYLKNKDLNDENDNKEVVNKSNYKNVNLS